MEYLDFAIEKYKKSSMIDMEKSKMALRDRNSLSKADF